MRLEVVTIGVLIVTGAWAATDLAAAVGERPSAGAKQGVTVDDDGKQITVRVGGHHVLSYRHAEVPSPIPGKPYYAKSGYLHPVLTPGGQVLTDDFNPDHAHQHGIMFAWRKTSVDGRSSNGWDQAAGGGKVEHQAILATQGGTDSGFFKVQLQQVDLKAPGGPKPILTETWLVRVYNRSDRTVFDLDAEQRTAGDFPVLVEKMHYGGMMLRATAEDGKGNYEFSTNEAKDRKAGDGTRARWVSYTTPAKGPRRTAVVFCHPTNFRFPQTVRLHPTMPYFCFTPATLGEFTIKPGEPYQSRYRFVVVDGTLTGAEIERQWQAYAKDLGF